jgi:hypothetical protein
VGGKRFSLSLTCLAQLWGPPIHVYSGKWPTFLGVQQSGHGVDHPSQSSADIKNQQSYTSTPFVWLIVHELRFYVSAQKKNNKQ